MLLNKKPLDMRSFLLVRALRAAQDKLGDFPRLRSGQASRLPK